MTDLSDFLDRATTDVAATRKVGAESWAAYEELDSATRAALRSAAAFLGHQEENTSAEPAPMDAAARRGVAALLLLRFAVDTDEPVWSSKALEDLVAAQLALPSGGVCDLFGAALDLWARHDPALSPAVVNFVRALTVLCFTQHRRSYQACDFTGLLAEFTARPSRAGAYLLAHALPPEHWAAARPALLAALDGTPQREQVDLLLSEDDD
ncbi:hypothetical protein UK23_36135 [Lentzea aerocolonigenes]|uniref:Uncharacterized protein n=1 Tax=Lentzea aerocolonigenes TaxID=68170 RepID=A0A0F0GH36_LENAE|nr:hypothetical protein [Lentzea aerocolonigenes]KJK42680.1 hypothetical protein UK23_36135 [Lentzea aerocolonigenes]